MSDDFGFDHDPEEQEPEDPLEGFKVIFGFILRITAGITWLLMAAACPWQVTFWTTTFLTMLYIIWPRSSQSLP